ncbi:YkgJ family cysteine cluster protein [Candidatus Poribacteria bacterium]|nr:YkgJ family cysteine cluster protein [Candidatus Poribacteria bacterium]
MKDGPIRKLLKLAALACFTMDLKTTRLLRRAAGEQPHRLGGQCRLCAKCCESPMIQTNRLYFRLRTVRFLMLAWHRHVNGFVLTGEIPVQHTFVFRCTHFDPRTRRCDSYSSRPGMCRDYPRALLREADPPFLEGCGYRAVSRKARRIGEILEGENLSPGKKEELRRKLHLDED